VCEIYASHGRDISDDAAASVTLMMDVGAYLPGCTALHVKFYFGVRFPLAEIVVISTERIKIMRSEIFCSETKDF
jgi:hypothetical protein